MYVNSRSCSVIGIKFLQGTLEFDFLFNKAAFSVVVKSFLFCSQYGKLCEKCCYVFSSVKYWGLSAGYQPRPQVVDRGTTARYGGQLRYI